MIEIRMIKDGWTLTEIAGSRKDGISRAEEAWTTGQCEMAEVRKGSFVIWYRYKRVNRPYLRSR